MRTDLTVLVIILLAFLVGFGLAVFALAIPSEPNDPDSRCYVTLQRFYVDDRAVQEIQIKYPGEWPRKPEFRNAMTAAWQDRCYGVQQPPPPAVVQRPSESSTQE